MALQKEKPQFTLWGMHNYSVPLYFMRSMMKSMKIVVRTRQCIIQKRGVTRANYKSMKENPQKLTQLSPRSHPRHLVGKRTAQKGAIKDITSDSQVNSYFPYRWSPASLTINIYSYLYSTELKTQHINLFNISFLMAYIN